MEVEDYERRIVHDSRRRMGAEADADNTAETVFRNFILVSMRTDGEAEARDEAFSVADGVDAPPELAEAMRAEFRAERFE